MAFIPVSQGVRVVVRGTHLGNSIVNVFGYVKPNAAPVAPTDMEDFLTEWLANYQALYLGMLCQDYRLLDITGIDLLSESAARVTVTPTGTPVGTSFTTSAPGNVAGVISWHTATGGRSGRGRTYVGPQPANGFTQDTMDSDALGPMAAFATALIGSEPTNGFRFGVISLVDQLARPVLSFTIDVILDSMRRRLTGRGA